MPKKGKIPRSQVPVTGGLKKRIVRDAKRKKMFLGEFIQYLYDCWAGRA